MQRNSKPKVTHGLSKLEAIELAPEEDFEQAAANAQSMPCPTLLGLGLDNRQFLIDTDLQTLRIVNSMRHTLAFVRIPIGRGKGPRNDIHRRLDQGKYPILRAEKLDVDVHYDAIMFATLADTPLRATDVAGTPFLVAEEGLGMPHTPAQAAQREQDRLRVDTAGRQGIMLCYRLRATNTSLTPAYAFFYQPRIATESDMDQPITNNEGRLVIDGRIHGVAFFAGQPWSEPQIAILLASGETCEAEYYLLHEPLPLEGVGALPIAPFDELLSEARAYWTGMLQPAASIELPEQRVEEMFSAGLCHLHLVTYGERSGTLAPAIGVYSPIGSESSPIIQFYDSIGWHTTAAACLQYFLDKQHEDGRFQNFGGYMLETGAALYTMGEHYRYTRDDDWVRGIHDQVDRACNWIIRHRREDSPRSQFGAGLIVGKVADPEDGYRQYMLNAYQYLGLARAAEMLHTVDANLSATLAEEASRYRIDIRNALAESIARSPLVPLGDGRWVPSCAPWVEATGPDAFALDGQTSYTHEAVYARDSLLGPIYTIFGEIIGTHEQIADFLIESHYEHMSFEGVAFSQPYYSRHPLVHLQRGEVRAFLRSFYRAMAALSDRETHTFWEHLFGVSPHKTHEEAWFLMEIRRMLYTEADFTVASGGSMNCLPGIPRAYLAHGHHIGVRHAKCYFGELNLDVLSQIDDGFVEATIVCPNGRSRGLQSVSIRLPHPDGRKARALDGSGNYDPITESVATKWPDSDSIQFRLSY